MRLAGTHWFVGLLVWSALAAAGCRCSPQHGSCGGRFEFCESGLVCSGGKCINQTEREAELVKQSLAGQPSPTEAPPADRRGRVRVRKTTGQTPIFASCAAHERLVGGGCHHLDNTTKDPVASSYPSHFSGDDTLGARWNCTVGTYKYSVEAYALCADARLAKSGPDSSR